MAAPAAALAAEPTTGAPPPRGYSVPLLKGWSARPCFLCAPLRCRDARHQGAGGSQGCPSVACSLARRGAAAARCRRRDRCPCARGVSRCRRAACCLLARCWDAGGGRLGRASASAGRLTHTRERPSTAAFSDSGAACCAAGTTREQRLAHADAPGSRALLSTARRPRVAPRCRRPRSTALCSAPQQEHALLLPLPTPHCSFNTHAPPQLVPSSLLGGEGTRSAGGGSQVAVSRSPVTG